MQTTLEQDPFSGHVFVFRGRRGDLIKALWWDGDGLCLLAKESRQKDLHVRTSPIPFRQPVAHHHRSPHPHRCAVWNRRADPREACRTSLLDPPGPRRSILTITVHGLRLHYSLWAPNKGGGRGAAFYVQPKHVNQVCQLDHCSSISTLASSHSRQTLCQRH